MHTNYPLRRIRSDQKTRSDAQHLKSSPLTSSASQASTGSELTAGAPTPPIEATIWEAGRDMFYVYTEHFALAHRLRGQIGRCAIYFLKGREVGWQFLMSSRVLKLLQDKFRFSVLVEGENFEKSLVDFKEITDRKKSIFASRATKPLEDTLAISLRKRIDGNGE